jgi:hypothetical protein
MTFMSSAADSNRNGIPDSMERKKKKRLRSRREGDRNRDRDRGGDAGSQPGGVRDVSSPTRGGGGGGGGGGMRGSNDTVARPAGLDTLSARTPFGKSFAEDTALDVFANPEAVSTQFMRNQGMDPMRGGGMTKVMSDLAAVMPDLFLLTQGGRSGLEGVSAPSFLDFAGNFMNQMGTPGGGFISPGVINNLFDAGSDSALGAFLNDPNADTPTQIQRLLSMMGAGLQTTIPGPILAAVMGMAQQGGTDFLTDISQGNRRGSTFADYLQGDPNLSRLFGIR